MTQEEMKQARFGNGDTAKYRNRIYPIASIDFGENLIGLLMNIPGGDECDISWVRCENVEFLPKRNPPSSGI
jgi:hypothetical protein